MYLKYVTLQKKLRNFFINVRYFKFFAFNVQQRLNY